MQSRAKAILVAAPRSGSGKTTVTLALIAALRRSGVAVRAAKCGPDYIDPAFHQEASRAPCFNLDLWAMGYNLTAELLNEASRNADLLIIEAAMGLFDGVSSGTSGEGSAGEIAARFGIPVLLVLDVSGQSQSAAAVAHGFASFDPDVRVAGVILNRVGSDRHRAPIVRAIEDLGLRVLGAIPRDANVQLPERHLGLVQALEQIDLGSRLERLADLAERHCDLAGISDLAASLTTVENDGLALPPPGQRIALASDAAFSFVYPHILLGWRRSGAEIVTFSPLADEAPPKDCDACWLPGGYPELHAGQLAAANGFKRGLAAFAASRPVHGECGGYMVLAESLVDAEGVRHEMAGLLSHSTSFADRRLHLGYRRAILLQECALGSRGAPLRGHEFHYATLIEQGSDTPLAQLYDGEGTALGASGSRRGLVSGTFFHAIAAEPLAVLRPAAKTVALR